MLDSNNLKYDFEEKAWNDGKKIAQTAKISITSLKIGYTSNSSVDIPTIEIATTVTTDNENYKTSMKFNREELLSGKCSCGKPHSRYYYVTEACEHMAASLIEGCKHINNGKYDLYTDRNAHYLLQLYTNDALATAPENSELAQIQPVIEVCDGEWGISFKIGRDKTYVVKNIMQFASRMKDNSFFSYGKDFEMFHNRENIEENSKVVADFIMAKCEEYFDIDGDIRHTNRNAMVREIKFTTHSITDIMEHMVGRKIGYNLANDYIGKRKGMVEVVKQNPELQMNINPEYSSDGDLIGVELDIEEADIYIGNDYIYHLTSSKLYISDREYRNTLKPFLDVAMKNSNSKIRIGTTLLASFYTDIMPKLEMYIQINEIDAEKIRDVLPEEVEIKFFLDRDDEGNIICSINVSCGNKKLDFDNEQQASKYSYRIKQKKIKMLLSKYARREQSNTHYATFFNDDELEYDFLCNGIEQLAEYGEIHVSEVFKQINITAKTKVSIGVNLSSDLINLDVNINNFDTSELKNILASYKRKKKFHKLKNGNFINIEDDGIAELSELVDGLHLSIKDLAKGKLHIPAYRALYIDKIFQESYGIEYERNQNFKHLVRNFRSVEDSDYEVPVEVKSILRNYQKTGYRWLRMLEHYKLNGILADDMGLGKTLQVITLLLSLKHRGNSGTSIVITPASLVYNWESEFAKFAPSLKVGVVAGTASVRDKIIQQCDDYDVVITSYDLLKRDIDQYEDKEFFYSVIDEAQYIKNHSTLVSKSVKILRSKHKLALTGTPIENRLSELWSIFDYLMPGFLLSYDKFKKEIEIPIVKNDDEQKSNQLKKMVSPFIMRRLKKDVLQDLPDKMEEITFAKMDEQQSQLYTAYVSKVKQDVASQKDGEFEKNKLKILAELTRLRQICCDPSLIYEDYQGESAKLQTCIELVENARDSGHKVLLFSQFTSMLEIIEQRLNDANIDSYKITGATPKANRLKLVDSFNVNDVPVFLISLKAGGTGLNLTGADVVIHYDPWWNVAAQNQATDRAHRIGQKNTVTVFKLIAKGTIEEKILKMQEAKQQLADQIINGETNKLSSMNKDDFMELFD